jgi:uncharacterized protein YjbJ (UPF0337 family)
LHQSTNTSSADFVSPAAAGQIPALENLTEAYGADLARRPATTKKGHHRKGNRQMATQQQLQGHWKEAVGRLKQKWGQLTEDELLQTEGDFDRVVGVVQRKTGESREAIGKFLDEIADDLGANGVVGQAKEYFDAARERVQETAEHVNESIQEGYRQAETTMSRHPLETVAVSFGVGLLGGLVVGLMIRPR